MYEIAVPGMQGALVSDGVRGYVNVGFILMMIPSALMAAGGAIFPIAIVSPLTAPWYKYYEALV